MFEALQRTFENEIKTFWSTTPIRYENVPFDSDQAEFIAITIRDGAGELTSIGNPKREVHVGVCIIQIFTQKNIGTGKARSWADTLARHFRDTNRIAVDSAGTTGDILIRTPYTVNVGEQSNHYQLNLIIPFETQEGYLR